MFRQIAGKSIFLRQHDTSASPISFCDDVDAPATAELVMAEDAVAVDQGIFVRLLVFIPEIAPIAAVVAMEVGC